MVNEWAVLVGHAAESGDNTDQIDRGSDSFGRCRRVI